MYNLTYAYRIHTYLNYLFKKNRRDLKIISLTINLQFIAFYAYDGKDITRR